jgi:hypothetical protein
MQQAARRVRQARGTEGQAHGARHRRGSGTRARGARGASLVFECQHRPRPLLQIVLVGQLGLRATLRLPEMRQFAQRVGGRLRNRATRQRTDARVHPTPAEPRRTGASESLYPPRPAIRSSQRATVFRASSISSVTCRSDTATPTTSRRLTRRR